MISNISHAASLTELASNPKSFTNCPDMHGGVPGVRGGRFRPSKIPLLAPAGKHKALPKSKRPRGRKNAAEQRTLPAVRTQERTKSHDFGGDAPLGTEAGYSRIVRSRL